LVGKEYTQIGNRKSGEKYTYKIMKEEDKVEIKYYHQGTTKLIIKLVDRLLLEFDISDIPAGAEFTQCDLQLYPLTHPKTN
jgi:hypothetical protein